MGQNRLARVLLVLASLAAALGYAAWTANRTVLDPGMTGTAAEAIVATPAVQKSLTDSVAKQADAVLAQRGANPQVRQAVARALHDPAVSAAFADAVASIHRAVLSGGSGRVTIDTRALTASVEDALAREDPNLAQQFRAQTAKKPLTVAIGKDTIPDLSMLRRDAHAVTALGFAAGLALLALSLLLWHERRAWTRTGRRIAYLAITPLLLFVVLPLVASQFSGATPEVVGAVMRSYRGRVLPSAVAFAAVGLGIAIASVVWRNSTEAGAPARSTPRDPGRPDPLAPAMTPPAGTGDKLYL